MGAIEIGIVILLVAIIVWLSVRLWCYRQQMKHISEELSVLAKEDTNYRLSSYCAIGKTEEVIEKINGLMQRYREQAISLKKENVSYRESITSISHDIRTPLTSAKGYIQMMQGEEVSEKKRKEYAGIIEGRLDAVTDMLNQLFEYARIEAGELSFEPECFNACNVFADTIALFYDNFLEKDCEPLVELPPMPCYLDTDRHAFVRIVDNLIKNALVHGKGGYELTLEKVDKMLVLRVFNNTDSIEDKDIERIFDRFYTTDKSRSRKTTGLGLAIVKRFVTQMGGTVEASLKGGRFGITVKLPMVER